MTGLRSLIVIIAVVFGALRLAHVGIPLVFPEARLGPVAIASLDDVRRQAGFAPILPAYRPASLGDRPVSMTLTFSPWRTLTVVWQSGPESLTITQRRGGPKPAEPPLARPFEDVPDSTWWTDGARSHLILARGDFWIAIETSLPVRDLRRFADTLREF
ncbi:MAG TPA: hypothetical protein VFO31_17935 [Vicinamibacterales bacterium]|nr:hypothetical protein [Vicinamibacterales bacterium]